MYGRLPIPLSFILFTSPLYCVSVLFFGPVNDYNIKLNMNISVRFIDFS